MEGQTESDGTNLIPSKNQTALQAEEILTNQAQKLYDQHKAYNTRRVYNSDWRIFSAWCQQNSIIPELASHQVVALFLTDQFKQSGIQPSTLTRRLAAIKFIFTQQQKPSPTDDSLVRNILKGIRRDEKVKPSLSKKSMRISILKSMVDLCPNNLRGIRDKAILLLGFTGAFRRNELANVNIEDLTFHSKGIDIKINRSKTDQEGKGKIKAIIKAKDEKYCPYIAVRYWLEKSQLTTGALFRGITKHNKIKENTLSADRIYSLVKKYIIALGYDADEFSPHSLRSGFVTAALENNALLSKIMDVTFHASVKSLQPYMKHAERYEQHAGKNLL